GPGQRAAGRRADHTHGGPQPGLAAAGRLADRPLGHRVPDRRAGGHQRRRKLGGRGTRRGRTGRALDAARGGGTLARRAGFFGAGTVSALAVAALSRSRSPRSVARGRRAQLPAAGPSGASASSRDTPSRESTVSRDRTLTDAAGASPTARFAVNPMPIPAAAVMSGAVAPSPTRTRLRART